MVIIIIISSSQSIERAHSTAVESDVIKSGHDRYDPMIEMAFFKQVKASMINKVVVGMGWW